ncbi:MAG: hypothetical protein PHS47_01365 [Methanocellales archaeon]|nr:hypothetical protein [Methanocellales archaeon]
MLRSFDLDKAREILSETDVSPVDSGFAVHIKSSRAYQKQPCISKAAVHIKSRNVNKRVGLKKLAELFDWPTDAVIGDSENDV